MDCEKGAVTGTLAILRSLHARDGGFSCEGLSMRCDCELNPPQSWEASNRRDGAPVFKGSVANMQGTQCSKRNVITRATIAAAATAATAALCGITTAGRLFSWWR